jgi:GT2 family glycosyltransferase
VTTEPGTSKSFTTSVVICAYAEKRWNLLLDSVASTQSQSQPPLEVIVSIDQRSPLLDKFRDYLAQNSFGSVPVHVVANPFNGEIGSARNMGATLAQAEIVVFLDDDAAARADWLEQLVKPYNDPHVFAVGGKPLPRFEAARPAWLPLEFDWTFGCAYDGLPSSTSPVAHLIGANLSVRRSALHEVGGFHWNTHDDMDLCHRVAHLHGANSVVYTPAAIVDHFVPRERTTWTYFWRRCFFENRDKVAALHQMGDAAGLSAEANFVRHVLTVSVPRYLRQAVGGDVQGITRLTSLVIGIALAGFGNIAGRIRELRASGSVALARGWNESSQPTN